MPLVNVTPEELLNSVKSALKAGCAILDTHHDRIDPPKAEFGDDDDDGFKPPPFYDPVDPYVVRPLPVLIGSQLFLKATTEVCADPEDIKWKGANRVCLVLFWCALCGILVPLQARINWRTTTVK